jgi:hypothetical protein
VPKRGLPGRDGTPASRILLAAGLVALWLALQLAHADRFIYHDAWKHGFPMFMSVARHADCGGLPAWISRVDGGSPLIIQTISISLTQLVRLPAVYLAGCLDLDLIPALYLYKAHLIASHLALAGGMFVLGRLLFERRLSALYLFAATLYAGLGLDTLHSSQVVAIAFWMPWMVAAGVLAHRHADERRGAWAVNTAVLFTCLPMLDQYPHYALLAAVVGAGLYAALWPGRAWRLLRGSGLALWPAAALVTVTGFQMWAFRRAILGYQPSLRAGLIVDPSTFGETGFVQPTAFVASFLPLGFLAEFDELGNSLLHRMPQHAWLYPLRWVGSVSRAFIARLDTPAFVVGFIPLVLIVAFALRPGLRRQRTWWFGFTLALVLVALQQSGLYTALFHVPFFNVLRIYFLYVVIAVVAALVISGYGLDGLLTLPADDRTRVVRRALGLTLALAAIAALFVGWLLIGISPSAVRRTLKYLAIDGALIVLGAATLWAGRNRRPDRWVAALMIVLAVSQAVYFVRVHRLIGIPRAELVERFGLEADDRRPLAAGPDDPERLTRKECQVFAQCYLSRRDTASLRRDEQGTFLRSADDAVFASGLDPAAVRALTGVGHPVFWLSAAAEPYDDRETMIERLNSHAQDIDAHLQEVVHVPRDDYPTMPQGRRNGHGELLALERSRDRVRLRYRSHDPVILNAGITWSLGWTATVDGAPVAVTRGNLNGLAVALPADAGEVELRYRSQVSDFFFASRFAELLLGLVTAIWIAGAALAGSGRPAPHHPAGPDRA